MVAVWARNDGVKTDASQAMAQTTYNREMKHRLPRGTLNDLLACSGRQ